MKVINLVVDGKPYTVEIEDPQARPLRITVNGRTYVVETQSQSAAPAAPPKPQPATQSGIQPSPATSVSTSAPPAASSGKITAPLPGKVLSVTVKVGARVMAGDEVCVVESVKMEQSLKSPQAGAVKAILVDAGQSVSHGQALVELG